MIKDQIMLNCYVTAMKAKTKVIPVQTVVTAEFQHWLKSQNKMITNWVTATNFSAKPGSVCFIGNENGELQQVLLGIDTAEDVWSVGMLPTLVQSGIYSLEGQYDKKLMNLLAIAWALGSYQYRRYQSQLPTNNAKLFLPSDCDLNYIENGVKATYFVRDLINTPTEDMGPAQIAEAAVSLADEFSAKTKLIIGDDLLKKGYPAIHAVGRASIHAPRLIELQWGKKSNPQLILVGKGVCFDSGGLDLKPAVNMRFMKKDMAGAVHVLGLARMIMAANLPIQLRVLIPAVENAISGSAIRPGDVLTMRSGKTVEITNTDAEGRLILADSLIEAAKHEPDLVIDFATLTGAARVALGPDPGAFFTNDENLARELLDCASLEQDPLWRLPLYKPYRYLLTSTIADICNADLQGVGGGAITAALFLQEFVPETIPWLHLDIMAWNLEPKPSRPVGGEAMGMRAVYRYIEQKFKK
jgi:leucyl aminopeptidase